VARRMPTIREIYKGIRKPAPPPSRVERDRRESIRCRDDREEIEKHKGSRKREGSDRED